MKKKKANWLRALQRVANFAGVFSALIFAFYVVGNFQSFLDETQLLLLSILSRVSTFLFVVSVFLTLEHPIHAAIKKFRIRISIFVADILLMLFGAALSVFSQAIQFLSAGIH